MSSERNLIQSYDWNEDDMTQCFKTVEEGRIKTEKIGTSLLKTHYSGLD